MLITEQRAPEREFQLPGGGIDPGESPVRALHRECLEETGWSIQILRHLGVYQRFCYMPEYDLWAHKICHIYLCRPGLRQDEPSEAGHRALWLPVELASRALSVAGDRHFVQTLLRRF